MEVKRKRKRLPLPPKDELEKLLETHTLAEAAEILGSHPHTVSSWKIKMGITARKVRRPIPEGFTEYCKKHTRAETAEHFGLSYENVRTMEERTGVKCRRKTQLLLDNPKDLEVLLKYFSKKAVAARLGMTLEALEKTLTK